MPLKPIVKKLMKFMAPSMSALGLEKAREAADEMGTKVPKENLILGSIKNITVNNSIKDTNLRIYTPNGNGPFPCFVFIHGGGWTTGTINSYDYICKKIAFLSDCITISIDEGLSPEYKFPQPVEECYEVCRWIYNNADELNIIQDKIAIGGDSSGGNISAAVSMLARDRYEFSLAYQIFLYPDMQLNAWNTESRIQFGAEFPPNNEDSLWYENNYLNSVNDASNPLVSPALSDNLKGLPPAFIITAEFDPLRDPAELFAKHLKEADVDVELKRFDGLIHGFLFMGKVLKEVNEAFEDISNHLRKYLYN
ncbi:MAG: alpha/beta hydrolase [Bacillota bacterium]|nr:alpha/beta hydrolase [Bacillota bacterium]